MRNKFRWKNSEDFDKMMNDFGRAMDNVFHSKNFNKRNCGSCNIYTLDGKIITEIDLPGINPAETELSIENNILRVKGERHNKIEDDSREYFRKEIPEGTFERRINLPVDNLIDKEISAVYKKGMLVVTIPLKEKAKKVDIKVED